MSTRRRIDEEMKNPIQFTEERDLGSYNIESIYSFKTMLRMLDQSGLVIFSQNTAAIEIPIIFFPFSWVKFVDSSNQNQSGESAKTGLIEVAACLLLFDECINKRNMSITSNLLPTCAIDHPQ
jgi:hypothetical protein